MPVPILQPFAALRPAPEYAQEVAAPPYDVVDAKEARALAKDKPWSFLHISRPEIDLPQGTDPYSRAVYAKGAENMARMLDAGVLRRDDAAAYYIYRIQMGEHIQTGIGGAGSVKAYDESLIRQHEFTRPDKENDRVKQILAVNAQTGPVFTTHNHDIELLTMTERLTLGEPVYSIVDDSGVVHTLWVVSDTQIIDRITKCFERLGVIYVADGHHRSAAASRVAAERKKANSSHTGLEHYNSILVVSFPETEVQILDYNRVVKDLNGLNVATLLDRIKESFEVINSDLPVKPEAARTIGMYVEGKWYALHFKNVFPQDTGIPDQLDVSILMANILSPVLGIGDPQTDPRIDFIGGIRGMGELKRRVDCGDFSIAFTLFPATMRQIRDVADAAEIMPSKTTWFEPKLADGLLSLVLD